MTRPRERENKKDVAVDKWKFNSSLTLLKLFKRIYSIPLLHISRKTIREVETDKKIPQFNVGYMCSLLFNKNKTFREQVEIIFI